MIEFIYAIVFLIIAQLILSICLPFMYVGLRRRVHKCEQLLESLRGKKSENQADIDDITQVEPIRKPPEAPPLLPDLPKVLLEEKVKPKPKLQEPLLEKKMSLFFSQFQKLGIAKLLREYWIGIIGAFACVIGVVFFGITSGFFRLPIARVAAICVLALSFWGISAKMKNKDSWHFMSSLFQSISGAIFLFATAGMGGIKGLQCIHSPMLALGCICLGIGANIYLAAKTPYQGIATIHVFLSLLALCIPSQTLVLLPIGTLVVLSGLFFAKQTKWDIHFLSMVLMFSIQNFVWTRGCGSLGHFGHCLATGCILLVGGFGATFHYLRSYKLKEFDYLPLIAHLGNWGLLGVNLYLHASELKMVVLLFAGVGIGCCFLASIARKKTIYWLYHTDMLVGQMFALLAMVSLNAQGISGIDIAIMCFVETSLFVIVCNHLKENLLVRIGYVLQLGGIVSCFIFALLQGATNSPIFLLSHLGFITAWCWGLYIYSRRKGFPIDHFTFIFQMPSSDLSISLFGGSISILILFYLGRFSALVECFSLLGVGFLGLPTRLKQETSWKRCFLMLILPIHAINWFFIFNSGISLSFFVLLALDMVFVFSPLLKRASLSKISISGLVLYFLTVHVFLGTVEYFRGISMFIPGALFLGYSLVIFEGSRFFKKIDVKDHLLQCGIFYLYGFLSLFVFVYLKSEMLWKGISLRICVEGLAVGVLLYWIAFSPLNQKKIARCLSGSLKEALLGFISLCVFVEAPEMLRPLLWGVMAVGLLFYAQRSTKRFHLYSWLYLICSVGHVAFCSARLVYPDPTFIERYHLTAVAAIGLQFFYAYLSIVKPPKEIKGVFKLIYGNAGISALLPVFLGIGLLFWFNYEKAVLTLLWVVLACTYFFLGLLVRSKLSIRIAMVALGACCIRLVVFDLVQQDLFLRAIVFLGVGLLMLLISIVFKKLKHRVNV